MNINILKGILLGFGYKNFQDFLDTTILMKGMMGKILFFSVGFSTVTVYIEKFIGLQPAAYFSLIILFILEFVTGVSASVYIRKEKFESMKMGRIVLKIFVYSIVLGLMNIFNKHVGGHSVFGLNFNFFEWIYFIVLNILILQLLVSVMENCESLGFKEVSIFLRIFRKQIKRVEETASGKEKLDDDQA